MAIHYQQYFSHITKNEQSLAQVGVKVAELMFAHLH